MRPDHYLLLADTHVVKQVFDVVWTQVRVVCPTLPHYGRSTVEPAVLIPYHSSPVTPEGVGYVFHVRNAFDGCRGERCRCLNNHHVIRHGFAGMVTHGFEAGVIKHLAYTSLYQGFVPWGHLGVDVHAIPHSQQSVDDRHSQIRTEGVAARIVVVEFCRVIPPDIRDRFRHPRSTSGLLPARSRRSHPPPTCRAKTRRASGNIPDVRSSGTAR